ncbi:hypothetical protein CDAR_6621 [Caerostris darwini]|uniref:Uncharacterized protein n=1 Tax=Caerostris darwini TaxID=1538125 RepID=A0AAV4S4R1_9ARAC|nr:hypothetical protein CDAR_6621 [Caerostris darwini]
MLTTSHNCFQCLLPPTGVELRGVVLRRDGFGKCSPQEEYFWTGILFLVWVGKTENLSKVAPGKGVFCKRQEVIKNDSFRYFKIWSLVTSRSV